MTNRKNKSKDEELFQDDEWLDEIARILDCPLEDRLEGMRAALESDIEDFLEDGRLELERKNAGVTIKELRGPYDSIMDYISNELGITRTNAARWALQFLSKTPPDQHH